jgi:hypothetical protein
MTYWIQAFERQSNLNSVVVLDRANTEEQAAMDANTKERKSAFKAIYSWN